MNNNERLRAIDKLLIEIDRMQKPSNFTYIDVYNLHTILKEYRDLLLKQVD